jgi:hypothetical protein
MWRLPAMDSIISTSMIWSIVFALAMVLLGWWLTHKRGIWSGTHDIKAEVYRWCGVLCLTVALLPLGYLASKFIDFQELSKEFESGGVVLVFFSWGGIIIKKNKFDINALPQRINLICFGFFSGLSLPRIWQLVELFVIGGASE